MTDQQVLRQRLRRARSRLGAGERAAAAAVAIRRVLQYPRFRRADRVAAYVGSKGELDPMPLLKAAAALDKACYLPVLHPFRRGELWFYRWRPGDPLVCNRFGIPEPLPRKNHLIAARRLDLVIVPLVGFDARCHRLGMGGGYYDRSFAFVRRLRLARRPFLLGFAFELQRVEALPTQPWDIALDAVATERAIHHRELHR